jgi:hypothetical protein
MHAASAGGTNTATGRSGCDISISLSDFMSPIVFFVEMSDNDL